MHSQIFQFIHTLAQRMRALLPRKRLWIHLVLAVCLINTPLVAYAKISKSEAASRASARHGGKVISVKKISESGNVSTYSVKLLLQDGRVKTVVIRG